MKLFLVVLQIIVSTLLIVSILLQSRGTGLGTAWGGTGESYQSRRGVEKFLFTATIALCAIFFIIQIAILV